MKNKTKQKKRCRISNLQWLTAIVVAKKLKKFAIPTLVLPYQYKPPIMTTTESFSESERSSVEP